MAYDPVFEAQEDIQIVNECIDRLNKRSRVSMSLCAAALHEARRQMIARDSEYQEAAWRVMLGELKKKPKHRLDYQYR